MMKSRDLDLGEKAILLIVMVGCLAVQGCDGSHDDGVVVTAYTGPELSVENLPLWSASKHDGMVTLTFGFSGDAADRERNKSTDLRDVAPGDRNTLTLLSSDTGLPQYLGFRRDIVPGYEGRYSPLRMGQLIEGQVQIQSWNLNGVASGRVNGRNVHGVTVDVYFRAELGQ